MTNYINLAHDGLSDNYFYHAWKFPGGELHFKLKKENFQMSARTEVTVRLNSSDNIMLLLLALDAIFSTNPQAEVVVHIWYMGYQQADRRFSFGECFGLKVIARMLNAYPVSKYYVFDPHSDMAVGLLDNADVLTNQDFIQGAIEKIGNPFLHMVSPDAGAYKKIFKLSSALREDGIFKGLVTCANKSRNITTGAIDSIELSRYDFEGSDVLIVDDICIGGRTFVELAKKIKHYNVGNLYLAVSHGIFSNGFTELAENFTNVFTTRSYAEQHTAEKFEKVPQSFLITI